MTAISSHLIQRLFKTVASGTIDLPPGQNTSIVLAESPEQVHLHFLPSVFIKDGVSPGCFSAWVHNTGLGDTALSAAVFYGIVNIVSISTGIQTYFLFIANHNSSVQTVSYSVKLIRGLN